METREQIERIEHFLKEVVVNEIAKLQGVGLSYMQFVIMGQAIEVLGSFLDNKPMKAKGQSAKRFSLGVKKLFGGRYRLLNDNCFLYDKLRNQMTHTFIPGNDLILLNQAENTKGYKHLQMADGKLVLISEVFYKDICNACERLLEAIKSGVLSPKNIAY
ncbi:hypothetical protein [Butyricimonas paravirosa]|uniref:hypothetical protein n=1 Tax=Butyricimonas paravirosa TaxID=1472417 RepID=UPI00210CA898|nr:hypothetical protein [Butyricimonas paravirosa]MCQ4874969.1 hypothetical protein [Butyricimonas paravirosa]